MSVKISQLGSEFDLDLAYENMREILLKQMSVAKCTLTLILRNIIVYNRYNMYLINLKENLKCRYGSSSILI